MILPETYAAALILSLVSMVCWGSWANTTKLTGPKWRFELYYYDYALGVLLAALIAAFTLGSFGKELSFVDNVMVTGKRQIFWATLAGIIFNFANILLVAAITIAGMAVAFPIGIGLALVIGVILNYILNPQANTLLLFGGVALVLAAIIVNALAYKAQGASSGSKRKSSTGKGIVISLVSGVLMGSFYPLVELSKQGDIGLGPYTVAVFFGIGVFFSTFVFNFYFMNLPIQGEPVSFSSYFRGTGKVHLLGIAGGVIWCIGAIANFCAASAPPRVQVGPAVSYALGQGATLISALWGLFVWKEFDNASGKARGLVFASLGLFVIGLLLVSMAPRFAR